MSSVGRQFGGPVPGRNSMAVPVGPPTQVQDYSASILSSSAEIEGLKPLVKSSLPEYDTLRDPGFFLASVSKGWRPRVVVVHNGTELTGVLYAKERNVSGRNLGLVYADLSFGSLLLGNRSVQEDTFRVALETLLAHPRTCGIRLRILRGGPEVASVRKLLASRRLDVRFSRVKDHVSLSLPDTYERLLQGFGSTTRHNFRYYRRCFEAAGHCYVDGLSLDELRSAAVYLEPRCGRIGQQGSIERWLKMVAAADRPLAVGLKHRNGEWLSVVGGVYRPGAALLLLQLNNDRDFPRESLSVVLRAYLIETLIRQGIKKFIIWAGTSPPLSRYMKPIPTLGIHLDVPGYKWRLVRWIVSTFGPWLPKQFRGDARWIAPFG